MALFKRWWNLLPFSYLSSCCFIFQNSCLSAVMTRFLKGGHTFSSRNFEIKSKVNSTPNQKNIFHHKNFVTTLTVFLRNVTITDQWKILRTKYEALKELDEVVSQNKVVTRYRSLTSRNYGDMVAGFSWNPGGNSLSGGWGGGD